MPKPQHDKLALPCLSTTKNFRHAQDPLSELRGKLLLCPPFQKRRWSGSGLRTKGRLRSAPHAEIGAEEPPA
jgi:hypothetical protein